MYIYGDNDIRHRYTHSRTTSAFEVQVAIEKLKKKAQIARY
jgi:hypothetical protein